MRDPVTVIIPVKDRQRELGRAIASALPQLELADELLVVDDGSQPPVSAGDGDGRIRVIRNAENKGAAGARNVGIANARNDVLAFLDSDDQWLEGKLAEQLAALEGQTGLVAVVSGWHERLNGVPFRDRIPVRAASRSDHFEGCWFCPGTTLVIHKQAFAQCGPYEETIRRLEDYEWFLRFAMAGGRLVVVEGCCAVINRGHNNKRELVETAVSYIKASYLARAGLTRAERRGMMAYLHLELAGACRNDECYLRMFWHVFTSLWYRPRLRIQLRNWWA
jgi:glycosyltransferase involved in cell wall biosynthesis